LDFDFTFESVGAGEDVAELVLFAEASLGAGSEPPHPETSSEKQTNSPKAIDRLVISDPLRSVMSRSSEILQSQQLDTDY
jgi:hypothetical protein